MSTPNPFAEAAEAALADARSGAGEDRATTPGPVLLRMSEVRPAPVRWLCAGRIPLGKLVVFAGEPGLGKSLLTIDLAARVSRGEGWPDAPNEHGPGGTVLLSAEDDPADTIRPRLDAAAADCALIHTMSGIRHTDGKVRPFTLDDVDMLGRAIGDTPDCRLVVLDPVTCYYARGVDTHRTADVRGVLGPLAELAGRTGSTILLVTHLNKGAGASALNRITGSNALPAAARAVFAVAKDRADESRRLVLPVKSNLGPDTGGLAFTIDASTGTPRVCWLPGIVDVSADEALAAEGSAEGGASAEDEAADWLADKLASGPVPSVEIKAAAKADGIAERTLERAKKRLGVEATRDGFGGPWVWRLRDGRSPPSEPKTATPGTVAAYGASGGLRDGSEEKSMDAGRLLEAGREMREWNERAAERARVQTT